MRADTTCSHVALSHLKNEYWKRAHPKTNVARIQTAPLSFNTHKHTKYNYGETLPIEKSTCSE